MSTTTAPRPTRLSELVRELINSGEISVAEARAELDSRMLADDPVAREHLALFILNHADDPDFRATRAYCHDCGTPVARRGDDTCPSCGSDRVWE